jgi:hypothetical protein
MPMTGRSKAGIPLARLLGKQSPAFRRDPRFADLESMLAASARLRAVRLGRRACALLNESRLKVENLGDFVETYRLPPSPFFRLFLTMKREARARLDGLRRDRETRIADIAATFPREARGLIGYLAEAERLRNPAAPLWRAELGPGSLKRAREMAAFGLAEWISFFADYIERLRGAYRRISLVDADTLLACMILECLPDPATGRLPSKATLRTQFKRLSKSCHPDLGGDPKRFLLLSRARDALLGDDGR